MNFEEGSLIKFKNGEYLVSNVIKNNENIYLYLINNDEYLNDVSIVKVISNEKNIEYVSIDNSDEFDYVINKLFLELKDDIIDYCIEE